MSIYIIKSIKFVDGANEELAAFFGSILDECVMAHNAFLDNLESVDYEPFNEHEQKIVKCINEIVTKKYKEISTNPCAVEKLIIYDGNIGVGKTTTIKKSNLDSSCYYEENVSAWNNIIFDMEIVSCETGNSVRQEYRLLPLFYMCCLDTCHPSSFKINAFIELFISIISIVEFTDTFLSCQKTTLVVERFLTSNMFVFWREAMFDQSKNKHYDYMLQYGTSFDVYSSLFLEKFGSKITWVIIFACIYDIDKSCQIMMDRIKMRNRPGEEIITKEKLARLELLYLKFADYVSKCTNITIELKEVFFT